MSAKTKIVVLKMKEIIYTGIFLGLALLLLLLFLVMFRPSKDKSESQAASYIPGVYSCPVTLSSQSLNVQVTVDADKINAIALTPLDEAVTTMYPLMQPTLKELADQIVSTQSLENLSYQSQSHYTASALLNAITRALDKAAAH